jgi:hypothetical protein
MKAILLLIIGVTALGLTGCESDLPRDEKPKVSFGGGAGDHEDPYSRQTPPATDLEKTPW